jgi:hypothetical protein
VQNLVDAPDDLSLTKAKNKAQQDVKKWALKV